jgi:peptidylprolyl isomerase
LPAWAAWLSSIAAVEAHRATANHTTEGNIVRKSFIIAVLMCAALPLAYAQTSAPAAEGKKTTTPSGLQIVEVNTQKEPMKAATGDKVWVHYTGKLQSGKVFDSSRNRNEPIAFNLGAGEVIKGWDEGIQGMQVGDKRQLIIPPNLAYGEQGGGDGLIPPNSTLVFDVELIGIERPEKAAGAEAAPAAPAK